MMLEGAGFEVYNLGAQTDPAEEFVRGAKEHGVNLVGMLALLATILYMPGRSRR